MSERRVTAWCTVSIDGYSSGPGGPSTTPGSTSTSCSRPRVSASRASGNRPPPRARAAGGPRPAQLAVAGRLANSSLSSGRLKVDCGQRARFAPAVQAARNCPGPPKDVRQRPHRPPPVAGSPYIRDLATGRRLRVRPVQDQAAFRRQRRPHHGGRLPGRVLVHGRCLALVTCCGACRSGARAERGSHQADEQPRRASGKLGYASAVCILAAAVFVVAAVDHRWVLIVSTAVGLALGLHLLLVLFMVMKRVFVQTQASLLRTSTGADRPDRSGSRQP